jgi:S-adenosylmethionine hydrolase
MPENTLFVCVVDPGVGGDRKPLSVHTGRYGFVGPDNGLLSQVVRRSDTCGLQTIDWVPARLSDTFHGRDLFAPAAARLSLGEQIPGTSMEPADMIGADWPADLNEIIYTDHYGNLLTGLRASQIEQDSLLEVNGQTLNYRRTFCEAAPGEPFWHADSIGLVEFSVNGGSAAGVLGSKPGDSFLIKGRGRH